jgi:hypothetical protein
LGVLNPMLADRQAGACAALAMFGTNLLEIMQGL